LDDEEVPTGFCFEAEPVFALAFDCGSLRDAAGAGLSSVLALFFDGGCFGDSPAPWDDRWSWAASRLARIKAGAHDTVDTSVRFERVAQNTSAGARGTPASGAILL
jgi:hypothetical protein